MPFLQPVDIANRALQHLGRNRINALTDPTAQAQEINACYDTLRRSELRRSIWMFATRRARLRPITLTTQVFTPAAWAIGTAYTVGQVVSYANYFWILNVAASTGDQPDVSIKWQHYFGPQTVDAFSTNPPFHGYDVGELAIGSDTNIYLSLVNGNILDPTTAPPGNWALVGGAATYTPVIILWPAGAGPVTDTSTKNVFQLPFGYLRQAPQNPKAGIQVWLGMATGDDRTDWIFEGNYFVSSETRPIIMRFVADVWDVTQFDAQFAEMFSARIALEVAGSLVEDKNRKEFTAAAAAHYRREQEEALIINAIETGAKFPPLDAYIACRF